MRIGIAGPISRESVSSLLSSDATQLPRGYPGAPMLGTLIKELLSRGHTVFAYTTSTDIPIGKEVTANGSNFKITFSPQRASAFRPRNGYWGRAVDFFKHEKEALTKAILVDRPDIIHAHWTYEFADAALSTGLPYLITCHDVPQKVLRYAPGPYRLVRHLMAGRILAEAKNLSAVSPYLQNALGRRTHAHIRLIPNPLPQIPPELASESHSYNPDKPCLAMVLNGWGKLKNPKPALRAFQSIQRALPGARLHVMGNDFGPAGKAASWAKAEGLEDNVIFEGPVPYRQLLEKLAQSDLVLHPSLEETFGMAVAEALFLGVPVIGGKESGAVPWIIGDAGSLVDVNSPDEISQAALAMLRDPARLEAAKAVARASAQSRFSASLVAQQYENAYAEILSADA